MKHTGYGNAAGLLLAHGLLAGGKDSGQENYSSDSETSDTEEYQKSKTKYVTYMHQESIHGHPNSVIHVILISWSLPNLHIEPGTM